ncbi:MAG: autotransporter-associated beta strand repeat-containing protein [Candidatus Accumulibacter sp.]|nr:autotransporter-associated beta strand repeat-containing protein [Accumulibacter sp.]
MRHALPRSIPHSFAVFGLAACPLAWSLFLPNGAMAANNTFTINDGGTYTHIFGNYNGQGSIQTGTDPTSGTSSENEITLTSATVSGDVVGGQGYSGSSDTNSNKVFINGGSFTAGDRGIFGGYTGISGGTANSNEITLNAMTGSLGTVHGGTSEEGGSANNNTVTINAGTIGNIHGGVAQGISATATGNAVNINGGTVTVAVVGGQGGGGGSTANIVTIKNGALVTANVFGGISTTNSNTNTVTIDNSFTGNITGDIYGGYIAGNAASDTATGNIVNINSSNTTFGNVYGGSSFDSSGDVFTGNTLNLAAGNTITSVHNMATLNFTSGGNAGIGTLDTTPTGASGNPKVTLNTNTYSVDFGGVINGTGGIDKTGTGTLTLNGNNIYSGDTTVTAGTLAGNIAANTKLTVVNSGATYDGSGAARLIGE